MKSKKNQNAPKDNKPKKSAGNNQWSNDNVESPAHKDRKDGPSGE